ncbi:MAG: hypothetical protein A2X64_08985 [Ignavibacteria bacterium GWF2_33_9]|nr:MAG: hypothetical protein A2X64_08985 [Ignavibacteria bacterium GWF2_33_9]
MKKLKFKLDGVKEFQLSGVTISNQSKISDFDFGDAMKLTNLLQGKTCPVTFVLNVAAINPNDGKSSPVKTDATISNLEWRLLIDDVPTISGGIDAPVNVPASGESVIIPISMNLDLYKFFKDQTYDKILNLAFAIGGVKHDLSHIKLDVKPTVNTMFGPITYPGRITIIDKEYTK